MEQNVWLPPQVISKSAGPDFWTGRESKRKQGGKKQWYTYVF